MTTQCCMCHKIKTEDGWILIAAEREQATHTYCPQCLKIVREELETRKRFKHAFPHAAYSALRIA